MSETAVPPPILDHVVVNVRGALDEAFAAYERLGFQLTVRGHHTLGSANHLAIFDTAYLELLGHEPGKGGGRADLWEHPAGLTGLAFKDDDGRYADLAARGVPVTPPAEFSRPVLLADGPHDARFRVVRLSPGEVQNGRTFFCHHYTPDLVWRPEWQRHPNTAVSVRDFVIATRDPARTASLYERMFGPGALRSEGGNLSFAAGATTIHILTPDAAEARLGTPVELGPDGTDRMVALVLRVSDIAATGRVLTGNGVTVEALPGSGLVVPASEAAGAVLGFVSL